MKALFLIYHGLEEHNGISKKILYQIRAFKECGIEMHLCYLTDIDGHKIRWINKDIIKDYGTGLKAKIEKRTDFRSIISYIKKENISFVYARHDHNSNPFTINLYHNIRKNGCKLLIEIPTYPYDQEYIGFPLLSGKINLFIDKVFRRLLVRYANYMITFSTCNKIWGKETIQISNGIDFSEIPLKKHHNTTSSLNLIGVAEIHYWHGFDRVIKGLGEYYRKSGNYPVYFHIIGNMGIKDQHEFQEIIKDYQIEKYIIFHGALHGESLTTQFEQANLGIGSLGRHRSGITDIKTLKNREYAARGIPFIYSENDSDFDTQPYVLKIPANEEAIDIEQLIRFYQSRQWSPLDIRDSIKNLSWEKQIQKVIHIAFNYGQEN